MLTMKPTKNLTGITIQADYNDLTELVDSIYRITGLNDNRDEMFYGVMNRLLGICYDIRHASQGDRNVVLLDNGMDEDRMKWHKIIVPKENVYYSVEVLFPGAIFIATAVPHIYNFSRRYYGNNSTQNPAYASLTQYYMDKANIDKLCSAVWQALGIAIGEEEVDKLLLLKESNNENYSHYATHYIDKCNLELLNTPIEKRKGKLISIANRTIKKSDDYYALEFNLRNSAKKYNASIYEMHDPSINYPESIEW